MSELKESRINYGLIMPLVIILGVGGLLATDIYVPSLPKITQAFGVSANALQFSLAIYLFSYCFSQLIYGPLSERIGRRKSIFIGLGIGIIGTVCCLLSHYYTYFLVGRFLQGAGMGATVALSRVIIRDVSGDKQHFARLASYLSLAVGLAPAIAPVVGGYLQFHFGWRSVFITLFFYYVTASSLLFYFLPETKTNFVKHAMNPSFILKSYGDILFNKTFLTYVMCSGVSFGSIIAYYTISPFLLQNTLHVSVLEYSWLAFFVASFAILGRLINTVLLRTNKSDDVLIIGLCLMATSSLLMSLLVVTGFHSLFTVIAPTCLYTLGTALVLSNAAAGALAPFSTNSGYAGALFGSIQIFVSFLSSCAASHLPHGSIASLALLLTGLSLPTLFVFSMYKYRVRLMKIHQAEVST